MNITREFLLRLGFADGRLGKLIYDSELWELEWDGDCLLIYDNHEYYAPVALHTVKTCSQVICLLFALGGDRS